MKEALINFIAMNHRDNFGTSQNPYARSNSYKSTESSNRNQAQGQDDLFNSPQISKGNGGLHTFSQAFQDVSTKHPNDEVSTKTNEGHGMTERVPNRKTDGLLDNLAMLQPHVLYVSTRQRGNGILRFIRNVPFSYANIVPDYLVAPNRCVLFLSFKYHNLHPQYIHRRIAELNSGFDLRILLCLVDVEDNNAILLFLNKLCCVNNLSLILAWTEEEAARYLETFKAYENKDASLIQKKKDMTFSEQVADTLGCIRSVNKTDAVTLLSQFGNVKSIMSASLEDIRQCPGIGEKKAKRLFDAFNKPFSSTKSKQQQKAKDMERIHNTESENKIATGMSDDDDDEDVVILDQ